MPLGRGIEFICTLMNITIFSFKEDAVVDIGVEHGTEEAYKCQQGQSNEEG